MAVPSQPVQARFEFSACKCAQLLPRDVVDRNLDGGPIRNLEANHGFRIERVGIGRLKRILTRYSRTRFHRSDVWAQLSRSQIRTECTSACPDRTSGPPGIPSCGFAVQIGCLSRCRRTDLPLHRRCADARWRRGERDPAARGVPLRTSPRRPDPATEKCAPRLFPEVVRNAARPHGVRLNLDVVAGRGGNVQCPQAQDWHPHLKRSHRFRLRFCSPTQAPPRA